LEVIKGDVGLFRRERWRRWNVVLVLVVVDGGCRLVAPFGAGGLYGDEAGLLAVATGGLGCCAVDVHGVVVLDGFFV